MSGVAWVGRVVWGALSVFWVLRTPFVCVCFRFRVVWTVVDVPCDRERASHGSALQVDIATPRDRENGARFEEDASPLSASQRMRTQAVSVVFTIMVRAACYILEYSIMKIVDEPILWQYFCIRT